MAGPTAKKSKIDIVALREQVELLELRVRRAQALEWLQEHKASQASSKKD